MGGSGGPCGSSESYEPGWDSVPGGCGGSCGPGVLIDLVDLMGLAGLMG